MNRIRPKSGKIDGGSWQRSLHDFSMPYVRGVGTRLTGGIVIPEEVQKRRDLNALADQLTYLRETVAEGSGTYTNKGQRSSVGANQFTAPTFVASTLPARESHYFREFLQETDPDKRARILEVTSPEMQRTLSTQWTAQEARIAQAEGRDPREIGEGGRLYTRCLHPSEQQTPRACATGRTPFSWTSMASPLFYKRSSMDRSLHPADRGGGGILPPSFHIAGTDRSVSGGS